MGSRVHLVDVAEMFQRFREEQFLCDTVITTRDGELRAHSLVLASVSGVFQSAFQNSAGPGMHHISLPDIDTETLNVALHFIYTGSLRLPLVYRDSDTLQNLFTTLTDLGLNETKLTSCEITFKGDDDDAGVVDNEQCDNGTSEVTALSDTESTDSPVVIAKEGNEDASSGDVQELELACAQMS